MKNIIIIYRILIVSVLFSLGLPTTETSADGTISGDVFERGGGYYHAFLSVAELYSDNIFNTHTDKESDSVTRINPGIWFMVPGGKDKLPETATASVTPGGVVIGGMGSESFRSLKAYAFYSPGFEIFANNTDQNTQSHLAEGSVEYKFSGGLSLGLLEQYRFAYDERGSTLTSIITTELDKYMTNLLRVFAAYDLSPKLRMEMGYTNFYVDYEADRNNFRDRSDTTVSGALFFKLFSKTSVFGEFEYMKIKYDLENEQDGDEKHYFCGIRWQATGKSSGMIKGGWGVKSFDQVGEEEEKILIFQAQVDHHFTEKTSVFLSANRRTNESNMVTSNYTLSENLRFGYVQKIRDKIKANLGVSYTSDSYSGGLTINDITKEREDELYEFTAGLSYAFRKWLTAGIEYSHSQRDSNYPVFEYKTNEIMLKVSCSL